MFLKLFRRKETQTDADFVSEYRRTGDLADLGELYQRHIDMVFAVSFKYLRDEDDAKDAVMQIFEQLVEDLKKHEVHHFKSWLHTLTRNYCLIQLRNKRMIIGDESIFESESYESFVADTTENEVWEVESRWNDLGDCLENLALEQRKSVELFYYQKLCYQQIAEQTGYAIQKVKSYLQNGKRNLKLCMEGKQHG
ncbi:sigma-70 family RNA polymerase sigma factor [Runella sp. MFBS21]|uniref:RNA polymerase sigma factor n=1 Tax=Runella sp. MFBS21 TaxID=3034018 RepID=UPI0023F6D83D|nr:sigma-70 family RNA polymerase sigma factor [Runella sp. MFBS21]MDF7821313.1 sigma-70 family RNA polymerase sigma factor [Runella sp. MFBS21]